MSNTYDTRHSPGTFHILPESLCYVYIKISLGDISSILNTRMILQARATGKDNGPGNVEAGCGLAQIAATFSDFLRIAHLGMYSASSPVTEKGACRWSTELCYLQKSAYDILYINIYNIYYMSSNYLLLIKFPYLKYITQKKLEIKESNI